MTDEAPAVTPEPHPGSGRVLDLLSISKTFPGQKALDSVSLSLNPGEVRALLGHNGSGKSTLIKIMAGVLSPDRDSGGYRVADTEIRFGDPVAVNRAGVNFIHQDLALIPRENVLANLRLGVGQYRAATFGPINYRYEREQARRHLDALGLHDVSPNDIVESLSPVNQTEVAIARAMSSQHQQRVLVLDEPTAALPDEEVNRLFEFIRRLKSAGIAIIYVSHRMEEIFQIADTVTVLREGKMVAEAEVSSLTKATLVDLVFGHSAKAPSGERLAVRTAGPPVFEFDSVESKNLSAMSFRLSKGEILGVAGLSGSGVHDVAEILAGVAPVNGGVIRVEGKSVTDGRSGVRALRKAGVSALLAPRKLKAFPELTLRENLTLTDFSDFWSGWRLDRRRERKAAASLLSIFRVRPPDPEHPLRTLSGGNQQKVFLARALRKAPKILVLEEPNQGVDFVGSAEILQIIREAARRENVAVLICSSDMEDLELICDRVLVVRDGRVSDELVGEEITRDDIIARCYA